MRRFFNSGLLLLLLLGLTGCQPMKQTGQPITLEFWTLQLNAFAPLIEGMIDTYEHSHPGIHIKWVDVPFSEGEKRTLTALMGEDVPDVVNLNPDFSAVLVSRNAVLDMNRHVPTAIQKTYLPAAWQASSLGEQAFGVPWYLTSSITIYNQALVKTPPTTFEELATLAKTLRAKNAYAVMPPLAEHGYFLKALWKAGIPLYDAQGRAVFADEGAGKHLHYWVDLYRAGFLPADALTEGHRSAVDRYQAGTLGLLMAGPNFLNIVRENAPSVYTKTAVAPQFPQTSPAVDFSTMVLVVPRRSKHPKEAIDFALFVTNAQNQLALAKAAPVLPSVIEALQNAMFTATVRSGDSVSQEDVLITRARALSASQLLGAKHAFTIRPGQHDINARMDYYVQEALLGKLDAETAMREAQTEINQLLSK